MKEQKPVPCKADHLNQLSGRGSSVPQPALASTPTGKHNPTNICTHPHLDAYRRTAAHLVPPSPSTPQETRAPTCSTCTTAPTGAGARQKACSLTKLVPRD